MFFCDADDFKINGMPMHHETIFDPDSDVEGPLYLRCDEGNPGEVFDSIEFMVCKMIIDPAQESVFHNLCLKYTGFHAIAGDGGYDVSFCEIGWIGGSPFSYEEDGTPVCGGNAVEAGSNFDHFSVTDCYIYQCYDTGISHQWNGESVLMQNITYARNVITHTDAAVEVFFTDRMSRMENILIEDNYFMYSGYGWYKGILGKETPWGAAYQGHAYPNMAENFRIENNVLYLSSGPLINTAAAKEHQPVLDGNTYIQTEGNILACWMTGNGYGHPKTFICESSNMQEVVTDILGDKNGIVFVLPENTAS